MRATDIVEMLTPEELAWSDEEARKHYESAKERNATHTAGLVASDNDININKSGAAGELAFANYLGVPWNHGDGPTYTGDVLCYEVRTTIYEHGRLLLQPKDNHYRPFVMVIDQRPFYIIAGWRWAYEVKKDKYWGTLPNRSDRPCYSILRKKLYPMILLPTEEEVRHVEKYRACFPAYTGTNGGIKSLPIQGGMAQS
jgi:hypothetical protein